MNRLLFKLVILLSGLLVNFCYSATNIKPNYDFKFIPNQWIKMPDGISLSINYWLPISKKSDEKFPIVLEVLPYRKDDVHFIPDYAIGRYFAERGIAFARLDIRGTGSSNGKLPDREYSDQELKDIRYVISVLAQMPWSNANIGMQGISWSAFNSMMMAMKQPKELKGILVAHGSDDLYANDIHNIDGGLHLDIFTIEIETDNLMPQSPHYKIDDNYFKNRFDTKPWIFEILKHQRDGPYWQQNRSLKTAYSSINIPVLAFAALLDGYRDFAINMLENTNTSIRVAVGPQNHSWPDGYPGPTYEWRQLGVQYWQQVLNGVENRFWKHSRLLVFMRDTAKPQIDLEQTPGEYIAIPWPQRQKILQLFPQKDGSLSISKAQSGMHSLLYNPASGNGILNWWGETTPDMREATDAALIYESQPIDQEFYLLGKPEIDLKVAHLFKDQVKNKSIYAHWIIRLEDVHPEGHVTFITGGLQNSAQHFSRERPLANKHDEFVTLKFKLHFSTWKFAKGHRIRLVITNAAFPMIWPTPFKMLSKIILGNETSLKLPIYEFKNDSKLSLPKVEEDTSIPMVQYLEKVPLTPFKIRKDKKGNVYATANEAYKIAVNETILSSKYKVLYRVNELNPADAEFIGEGEDSIHMPKQRRRVNILAKISIHSDAKNFHVTVTRRIFENEKLIKSKVWHESIPRDFE